MNDAMTWTLIGGFFALTASMGGLMLQVMKAEFRSVRAEIGGVERSLTARIDGVEHRLGDKIDSLEGDVSLLLRRLYGEG